MKFSILFFCQLFLCLFSTTSFAEEEQIPVEFSNSIETCLSKETLWTELSKSMINSEDSQLWPQSRSEVEGEGLKTGAKILVTYKSLFFSPTYSYTLSEVEEGTGFTYTAVEGEHPFIGGASLSIESIKEGHQVFHWKGLYLTNEGDWIERRFFDSYSESFFEDLEENIRELESSANCSF